jgi:ribosomal protein L11 methylase PrmA
VSQFIEKINPVSVWDLGANLGIFSRIASDKGIPTVAFDVDHNAIEKNYLDCVSRHDTFLLPLLLDLTNPSPGIGWRNKERMSLVERGSVDMVLALALIHHLAITNNLPFEEIAGFLNQICNWLIIEFIPKNDDQVKRLLSTREDIFSKYNQQNFEKGFSKYFSIKSSIKIKDSDRALYLMQKE